MDFEQVLPFVNKKPVLWLAGDSITQSYKAEARPQTGGENTCWIFWTRVVVS